MDDLTIEDFEKLPDALAHNHELVDGKLVDVSDRIGFHHMLRDELSGLLHSSVREHQLGRVIAEQDFDFDGNAHGPDISFFGPEKAKRTDRDRRVQLFVPDLAIEIISPNDKFEAVFTKVFDTGVAVRRKFMYSPLPPNRSSNTPIKPPVS
jgi:Uma2 family endonuclease